MMHMYTNNIRISKKIAIGTIISGLIFLAAYYFTNNFSYAYGGIFFGLGVAAIVITILISAMIAAKRQNFNGKEKSVTMFWNIVTLASIIIYTFIGLNLVNSSRIIVKNNLDTEVKNVYITGCQNFEVGSIDSNSTKTIFVNYFKNLDENCSIGLRFTTVDTLEDEILIASVKKFQGEKIVYEIN